MRGFPLVAIVAILFLLSGAGRLNAAPRMVSFKYNNCVACHVSPQGRGLLKPYGRGIDIDQSYSDRDFTAEALGRLVDPKYAEDSWRGYFGSVQADVTMTARFNHEFDTDKDDPAFATLYRQILFFGEEKKLRLNSEIGYRDTDLHDLLLGPHLTALGGQRLYLKKLMLEWRFKSGSEVALGRDYLPIGLQIDDHTSYILNLNRNGIYDYPLQLKYFTWTKKWLAAAAAYAPTFDEEEELREYGVTGMYEYYLAERLALGAQTVLGFGEQSDRLRIGPYVRWGISEKWALLAEVDYSRFWEAGATRLEADQVTAFLQLHYHHYEWLVSSLSGNYAYGDLFASGDHHFSGRYTLSARLSRNLTLGLTCSFGDSRRSLARGEEGAVFASMKF